MNKILRKQVLTEATKLFVVENKYIANKAQAGQFVILRVRDEGERIPLTIAGYDPKTGTITLVVQEVGLTTRLLGQLEEGDKILDLVGPLGVPAVLPDSGIVAAVGGGVGVAPILPKCKEMYKRGVRVVSIIGARSQDLIILEEEIKDCSNELHICTDDGSRGFHGFVSDKLKELIDSGVNFDEVVAVGPLPMMRATCEVTKKYSIKTWVSMNPIMVDGTGMCGACRVTVGGETKFACVDGPMFDGHLIDWQEAGRRNNMYRKEEETANQKCPHCGGDK